MVSLEAQKERCNVKKTTIFQ